MPPVTAALASPSQALLQETSVWVEVTTSGAGSVMLNVCVATQPFASVTVAVYVPAARPLAVAAVPPLGDQAYEYAGVPPVTVTVAEPVLPPLQATFVCAPVLASAEAGCVMLKVCEERQPLASVIVTV